MSEVGSDLGQPRVIARIMGGLGNQLFCYAAARRLAAVNHAQLILDNISGFSHDTLYHRAYALQHFNIKAQLATSRDLLMPFGRVRRKLLLIVNRYRSFDNRNYLRQEGLGLESRLIDRQVKGTVYLDGSWQSEDYFKDAVPQLREDLKIQPPVDYENIRIAEAIGQSGNPVAVHVRWFDSPLEKGSVLNLAEGYYTNAINLVEEKLKSPHYFVFSDNIDAARALLQIPELRATFIAHNNVEEAAFADLWLMTRCRHFILSNSTLNWWGAWLSKHKEIVTYPEKSCFSILDDQYKCLFSAFLQNGFMLGSSLSIKRFIPPVSSR